MSEKVIDLSRILPSEVKERLRASGVLELYITLPLPGAAIVFAWGGILLPPAVPLPHLLVKVL